MKKFLFKGCATAICTPFDENGVNIPEFRRLVEDQIKAGIDALVVCGTTGEASCMTLEEKKQTIKCAVDTSNGRVPIIAGCGGNNTESVIQMCKCAETLGVDGLLIVTPYYNKTTQAGLIKHYTIVANSTSLPIILYNIPGRTGLNITPETCLELSKIPNIVAIKEASGNLSQVAKIASICKDNLHIYSGNDDQVLPVLSLGGLGVISVISNIAPKKFSCMTKDFFNGNIENAINVQLSSIPLIEALFCEVNPIPIKEALNMLGYNFGTPRLPLVEMSDAGKEKLKKELKLYGFTI